MKHIKLSRAFSLLITLAFLLAFIPAPTAFAASESFVCGCQGNNIPVYYDPDTGSNKTYETLSRGDRISVRDKLNNNWWRVYVQNNISGYEDSITLGFVQVSTGAIPSAIPTDTFTGEATTNKSCYLYSCPETGKNLCTIPNGTKLKVIQQASNSFFLVYYAPQMYGYVQADDINYSVTAPTVTPAAGTTPTTTTTAATSTVSGFSDLKVASKGKLATNAMLYGTNDLTSKAIAQTSTGGDASIYCRVSNDFYLISTGANNDFFAYVPCQSITPYDMAAIPHVAGAVGTITVTGGQTVVSAAAAAGSSTATIANCSSWVSMRAEASSKAKRVCKLSKGKTVTVLGTSGSYTKIKYDGKTGYVLSTYVK